MAIEFLKKASKTPQSGEEETVRIVEEMLQAIESTGEEKVREYTKTLDKYSGNVVVTPEEIAKSASSLSKKIKDDIKFACNRVRTFAKKQLESITEFESEIGTRSLLRTEKDPDGNSRVLCSGRTLCPCSFSNNEHHNSQGCRS